MDSSSITSLGTGASPPAPATVSTSTMAPAAPTHPHQPTDVTAFFARRVDEESYDFSGWKIHVTKSSILPSNCYCHQQVKHFQEEGITIENSESISSASPGPSTNPADMRPSSPLCSVCRYANELPLKHLPEMVFPDNVLRLVYQESEFVLEFNTFDALKLVNSRTSSTITVACSENWKASKVESGLPIHEALQPYDWTYTTDYKGSIHFLHSDNLPVVNAESNEKLDLEKLKQHETILFYQELQLYEDELHDNGVSNLSIKIRVMPSGFFILQRFFLRVDQVLIKICDTRVHYEVGNNYFLRQFQTREQAYSGLSHLEPHLFTDPNVLYSHLPIRSESNDKIFIGRSS